MEIPIPDDWNGEDFCKWAICWPDSIKWKSILYGLLELPNQGRFWDFKTGSFLNLRSQFREAYDYNFNLKEVIMTCQDTSIADALQAIATALTLNAQNSSDVQQRLIDLTISQNACCEQTIINQGGFTSGNVTQGSGEAVPIFGTQPPLDIPVGTFPEGYESLEEYQLDKCQMSNLIFDGWLASLRNLGALTVFNGIALAGLVVAALAGAIVFPPAAIPIMCAAIGVLSVEVTILAVVADEMETNRNFWVCILYNSDSTEQIVALIADALDALIASLSTSNWVGFAIKQICLLLLNSDTLNGLMEKRAHLDYPGANCAGCIETCSPLNLVFQFCTILSDNEDETERIVTLQSGANPPAEWQHIVISAPSGCHFDITAYSDDGWVGETTDPNVTCDELPTFGFYIVVGGSPVYFCTATIPIVANLSFIALYSDTSFTFTATLEGGENV